MRIISNFRDYYDSAQSTGQDRTLVYLRREKGIEKSCGPSYCSYKYLYKYDRLREPDVCSAIIGFCGKIYGVIEIHAVKTTAKAFCYSLQSFDNFIKENFTENQFDCYHNSKGWTRRELWPHSLRRLEVKKFFDECEKNKDKHKDLFVENKSPLFVSDMKWHREEIRTKFNVALKDYEFFRMFDTYTAFQEIAMYLGGVLGQPNKEMPKIDDETMAEIKGFDKKTSFRKAPGDKKRKRSK